MSMRIFSEEEFHNELKKHGFSATHDKTNYSHVWLDKDMEPITVPCNLVSYPDYLLDELLRYSKKDSSDSKNIEQKLYAVEGGKI